MIARPAATRKRSSASSLSPPRVNRRKCTTCGLCLSLCPSSVFIQHESGIAVANPQFCIQCGHCGSFCPSNAIAVPSVESKRLLAPGPDALPSPNSLQLLLRSRRSVRQYKHKTLTRKDLNRIIEAGRYTATGSNCQNIRYIVIADPDRIAQLREMTLPVIMKMISIVGKISSLPFASQLLGEDLADRMKNLYAPGIKIFYKRQRQGEDRLFYNAPAVLMVCADRWDDTSAFSCSAALYNGSLMAHTLGIGCCFNGFLQNAVNNNARIRRWLGIPRHQKCYGAMTLGYQNVKYNYLVKRNPPDVTWL
jgi:nitroreductase/Pyruvate/2-oxoacid:ferredoxin oxidoreductase delta subunit